jgi:hypothetical protein
MEELVSSMITATGTFWLGAAGVYKFSQMPRGPAPERPEARQGELPRVVEVRVRCAFSRALLVEPPIQMPSPCRWGRDSALPSRRRRCCTQTLRVRTNVPLRRTCVALLAGGALVDHVAFVMSDGTVCGFGGNGGTLRPPFVLRDDETIVAVEGAGGDALDRIQFVTSSGRQSPPFGGEGGAPFRLELPDSRSIGGLVITQSVRGWIRQLHGVKDVATAAAEADAAQAAALAAPGFVTHHRARLRTTTLWVGGLLTAYAVLILMVMSPLLLELARGPVAIDQAVIEGRGAEPASLARRYVTLEETRPRGTEYWGTQTWTEAHSFQGRWLRERRFEHRWAALKIPKDLELPTLVPRLLDDDDRLLVKTSVAQDTGDHLSWVGILSALEPAAQQPGRAVTAPVVRGDSGLPRYYLDTCLSPIVIWLTAAVAMGIGAYGARMLLSLRLSSHDIVARALLPYTNAEATAADHRRQSIDALIRSIDGEVSEEPNEHGVPHVFEWGTTQVAVTQTWILKASRLGFNAAAVADCPSISRPTRLSRQYIGQERVEVVTVRVENTGRARAGQSSFDVQLTTEEFRRLEASTLNRLQEMRAAIGTQRSQQFGKEFVRELRERQGQEGRFWPQQQDGGAAAEHQTPEACMGCSRPSTVKIAKICETCPERAEVRTLLPVAAVLHTCLVPRCCVIIIIIIIIIITRCCVLCALMLHICGSAG